MCRICYMLLDWAGAGPDDGFGNFGHAASLATSARKAVLSFTLLIGHCFDLRGHRAN